MADRILDVSISVDQPEGEWETHWVPWWRERSFLRRGYTINHSGETGLLAAIQRLLGIREARAVKYHPPVAALAPSLDMLHPAFADPVTAYLPRHVFQELGQGVGHPRMVYPSVERWNESHVGVRWNDVQLVEVEIRMRRVVDT